MDNSSKFELLDKIRYYHGPYKLSSEDDIALLNDLLTDEYIQSETTSYYVGHLAKSTKGITLTTDADEPRTMLVKSIWLDQNEGRVTLFFKIDGAEYRYTVHRYEE